MTPIIIIILFSQSRTPWLPLADSQGCADPRLGSHVLWHDGKGLSPLLCCTGEHPRLLSEPDPRLEVSLPRSDRKADWAHLPRPVPGIPFFLSSSLVFGLLRLLNLHLCFVKEAHVKVGEIELLSRLVLC